MTEQLPAPGNQGERREREPMPEVTKYPDPFDQQFVDECLRDPLTPAAEHLRRLQPGKWDDKKRNQAAVAAYKRLQKPVVKEYMRVQQERLRIAADLEREDLQQQLVAVINTDIGQVAQWDDEGRVVFAASRDLPTHTLRAIKKLKTKTTRRYFKDGGMEETTNTELEMYSRHEAIELFAKIGGILKDERGGLNVEKGVIIMPAPQSEEEATQGKVIHEG